MSVVLKDQEAHRQPAYSNSHQKLYFQLIKTLANPADEAFGARQ